MTAADRAFQLVSGFRASQLVRAACVLKIPDLLAGGPMTSQQLSVATGIDEGRMYRLLRGLVVQDVLAEGDHGEFANTEVGEIFREDVPGSRRPMALLLVGHDYLSWSYFMETLRTGVTGQELAYHGTLWDSMARDPDYAVTFNQAMASNSEAVLEFVCDQGDFAAASLLVDVGGGKGGLVGGIVARHPHLHGIVCDLPAGLADAPAYLASLGVQDRCSICECDFFKTVPAGGDVYLLKDILHDWPDDKSAAILYVCRRAMKPGARLMIVERWLPDRVSDEPVNHNRVMTDLQMMVLLGGRERTVNDFGALFEESGFRMTRSLPGFPFGIVEAVAV